MDDEERFTAILLIVGPSPHPGPFPPSVSDERQGARLEWREWYDRFDAWTSGAGPDYDNIEFNEFEAWQLRRERGGY